MTPSELIDALEQKFGDHSKVALALGYSDSSSYRRARREALKRGEFPGPTHRLALLLVSEEGRGNAA